MKKKKPLISENYLEKVPVIPESVTFRTEENNLITILVENKGMMNRLAQKLLKKPRISYVHLDEFGSFVWQKIDGISNLTQIGVFVQEHFGEAAEPLYPRLAKYISILESYGFVTLQ